MAAQLWHIPACIYIKITHSCTDCSRHLHHACCETSRSPQLGGMVLRPITGLQHNSAHPKHSRLLAQGATVTHPGTNKHKRGSTELRTTPRHASCATLHCGTATHSARCISAHPSTPRHPSAHNKFHSQHSYIPQHSSLAQAQDAASLWFDVNVVEAGPSGQARHGHHVAHQGVQEACTNRCPDVPDGQREATGSTCRANVHSDKHRHGGRVVQSHCAVVGVPAGKRTAMSCQ